MNDKAIMIIDDNEADRYLLKRDLQEAGFEGQTLEAVHGQNALDLLRSEVLHSKPKLETIFLDINMPLMDGFEFLQQYGDELCHETKLKETKIIMYTSSDQQQDIERVKLLPFVQGFLVKGQYHTDQLHGMLNL